MGGIKWNAIPASIYVAAFLSLLLVPVTVLLWPGPFESIDAKIYDFKLRFRCPPKVDSRIVHLDIDDRSVKKFGLWPWDRKLSGQIVTKLKDLGASVIVFDIFFPSEGKTQEGDKAFFRSIDESGRVVSATTLGITLSGSSEERVFFDDERKARELYDKAWPVTVPADMNLWRVYYLRDSFVPLIPIMKASKYVGHIVSTPDKDGVHRRIPVLVKLSDRCVPSLSLAALVAALNADPRSITIKDSGYVSIRHPGGMLNIPVDREGNLLINWPGKREGFPCYSAAGLLDEDSDTSRVDLFKNKIVIIAYAATGTTDMGLNPLFNEFLLSRIHSCALNTMLTGQFIKSVHAFPFVVPLASIVSMVFAFTCLVIRHRYGIVLEIAIAVLFLLFSFLCFYWWLCSIPIAAPFILFTVSATAFLVARAITMERQVDRVSSALQRYLSPQMLESIIGQDHEIDLSTRRKELTILFVDIKGFSTMSETMEVEYLEKFLNDFLEAMTTAVFENGGTIDKFLGDGLLAFFGDPFELENHARSAISAARQMQQKVVELNAKWSGAGIQELSKGIQIRIGINTGVVVVGNIGSQRRMEYTVVGSAVNVASRLQEVAPPDGILVSARTFFLATEHIKCKEPRTIRVKGVEREIKVYEIESVLDGGYSDSRE